MNEPFAKIGRLAIAGLMTLMASAVQVQAQTRYTNPYFDPVCGAGQDIEQGCDTIKARAIINVTQAPWRGIGRVNFAGIRVRTHCTGTLVAPKIVLTAAHCLYNEPRNAWIPAKSMRFVAGYQRGEHTAAAAVIRYVMSPAQDASSRIFITKQASDWALLVLDAPIGTTAGMIDTALSAPVPDDTLVMVGYPRLRPHAASLAGDCDIDAHIDRRNLIVTDCAAMRGDSGGPLLAVEGDRVKLVGINIAARPRRTGVAMVSIPPTHWAAALEALKTELRDR